MLTPGLDTEGMISAGPLSFSPGVKFIQRIFSYAELVTIGTTPTQIIGGVAGKIILPLYFVALTDRTNITAGTTVPNQLRFNGSATSIMGANVSSTFANGPGATLFQYQWTGPFNAPFVGTAAADYRGTAVMFVPTAAHLATGCVGRLALTIAYIELANG